MKHPAGGGEEADGWESTGNRIRFEPKQVSTERGEGPETQGGKRGTAPSPHPGAGARRITVWDWAETETTASAAAGPAGAAGGGRAPRRGRGAAGAAAGRQVPKGTWVPS